MVMLIQTDRYGLLWFGAHFRITYGASRASGMGIWNSLKMAWNVMWVDKGTQGISPNQTVIHAMGTKCEAPNRAKKRANNFIADPRNNFYQRIHAAQDKAAPWHYGQPWDGNVSSSHIWNDVFYGDEVGNRAFRDTLDLLGGLNP